MFEEEQKFMLPDGIIKKHFPNSIKHLRIEMDYFLLTKTFYLVICKM